MRCLPPTLLVLLALLLTTPALDAQNLELRVDFGTSSNVPPSMPEHWSVVHPGNQSQPLPLPNNMGQPTGVSMAFVAGQTFVGANSVGTSSPVPNSPLALTGFPVEATGDYIYGSNSQPLVRFMLNGLAPGGSYDLVFAASRMNIADQRETRYTVIGANTLTTLLEPANNEQNIATVTSALADASGTLTVEVAAGPANNNSSGFFYLNAMSLSGPPQPGSWLLFDPVALNCSRIVGYGPFDVQALLLTNTGNPTATLSAIDLSTSTAPTWLTWPTNAPTGAAIPMTVDSSALAIGSYAARLSATASGFIPATIDITLEVRADDGSLNLLFYGNSYSIGNGGIHNAVRDLAEAAGHTRPQVFPKLAGGQNLYYHLTNPSQAAAITSALPLGEEWDFVVMQGFSLEATMQFGDPVAMAQNAGLIVQNVRAHSPNAKAVLFQTWARGPQHSYYSGASPAYPGGPVDMHNEIRAGYENARQHIDALFGPGTSSRARAGEAFMLKGWDSALYTNDGSHQTPSGTLAAAMAVTTAIYGDLACDMDPGIGGTSALAVRLNSWGLGQPEWDDLATVTDRSASPSMRNWPGSDDDLLLRSATPTSPAACAHKTIASGDTINLRLESPGGTFDGTIALVAAQLGIQGAPHPVTPAFPELHLAPPLAVILGLAQLSANGHNLTYPVPVSLPGFSVVIQGFAVAQSPRTLRPITATDTHELHW